MVPILHHVHELDCLGGVDGTLPAEPDVGIDVVGVGGDVQLMNRDGVKSNFDDLSRGGRLFLWPKRSFLEELGLRIADG